MDWMDRMTLDMAESRYLDPDYSHYTKPKYNYDDIDIYREDGE